jgi:CHASE2 domain-containing sensor protein
VFSSGRFFRNLLWSGYIEEWRAGDALYFTFVTGLTIGYGDLTPKHLLSRVLAVIIGFAGIVLTGLVAAVSVKALGTAADEVGE